MLYQRHLEKDKERARKRLALPHFAQHEVPDEPKEVVEFFKDFPAVSSDEKIARWSRFKEEQKQYLATWKQESKAKRLAAQGRPEKASGSSRRVPTPPPPPAKPGQPLQGTTSKAAHPRPAERSQGHWIENLQDSRKIGQLPPLLRTKSEASRGDPSGASSSGTAPRLILEANPTASADFNDKQPDHKWVIVPALDDPDQFDVRIADCASRVAKTSGLADRKGTL